MNSHVSFTNEYSPYESLSKQKQNESLSLYYASGNGLEESYSPPGKHKRNELQKSGLSIIKQGMRAMSPPFSELYILIATERIISNAIPK